MKCRLTQNTYLTVIGLYCQPFNRPYNAGEEFKPLYRDGEAYVLEHTITGVRVYVSAGRLRDVFKQVFDEVKPFKGEWADEKHD